MAIEVGMILDGKITRIEKFGAFVQLEDSQTGMVHISEVAPTFINEISDYVSVGQEVKVKVLAVNNGRISLSMKQALPKEQQQRKPRPQKPVRERTPRQPYKPAPPVTSPGDYEWQSSRRSAPTTCRHQSSGSRLSSSASEKMMFSYSMRTPASPSMACSSPGITGTMQPASTGWLDRFTETVPLPFLM